MRGDADAEEDTFVPDTVDDTADTVPEPEEDTSWWECIEDLDCDDSDPCTRDACDPEAHTCSSEPFTGPALAGPDVRITDTPYYVSGPHMVWTGGELGLAWTDGRYGECVDYWSPTFCRQEVMFARSDPRGMIVGEMERITDFEAWSAARDLMWTGSEFVIAWSDRDGSGDVLSLVRIGADGGITGSPVQPTTSYDEAWSGALAWTGSEIALLWMQGTASMANLVALTRFSPDLVELGSSTIIDLPHGGVSHSLAWTGSEFGTTVRYGDGGERQFVRLSSTGDVVFTNSELGVTYRSHPGSRVTWTGSEFILIMNANLEVGDPCPTPPLTSCNNLLMHRLSPAGDLVAGPDMLTDPDEEHRVSFPSAPVWTGSELALFFELTPSGSSGEARILWIAPDGTPTRDELVLPSEYWGSLVWTGSEYVIGFSDWRDGAYDVYMNRVMFCD